MKSVIYKLIIKRLSFLLLISFIPQTTIASEIDSFTLRYEPIENSRLTIDHYTQKLLKTAIHLTNQNSTSCKTDKLYSNIRTVFANRPFNRFQEFLLFSDKINQKRLAIDESIYQDLHILDSFVLGGLSKLFNLTGSLVRMDDYLIGNDKFAHFFNKGWKYYRRYYKKNWDIKIILQKGLRQELKVFGLYMTGIASFADLSANFAGLRFWNQLVDPQEDILNKTVPSPMIECHSGRWVQVKTFHWMDYIDASWDEAYNCNISRNNKILEKINLSLQKLKNEENHLFLCPLDKEKILSLKSKYGLFYPFIINSEGGLSWEVNQNKFRERAGFNGNQ